MSHKALRRRPLTVTEILVWADRHHGVAGKWPTRASGCVVGTIGETWQSVDNALRQGLRGLPGGSSLRQLLAAERGVRHEKNLPDLSPGQVLDWADAHHRRAGAWPKAQSGSIAGSGGETWSTLDAALRLGTRGFSGGSSLARFLAEHRGHRNRKALPPYTEEQILGWADAHHDRSGSWPARHTGPIAEAPGETWLAVDMALRLGRRGFPGGASLALLLAERRAVRNFWTLPDLTIEQVLAWADAFHARTGGWPHAESGPIAEAPEETWMAVHNALRNGRRGLPGGTTLARLLNRERGVRNLADLPRLSRRTVLAWADAFRGRTGQWPDRQSGPIPEAPGDTWASVDAALGQGHRGLRGGSSLAGLLARHRGRRNVQDLPPLSRKKILAWADAHHERTGAWPNVASGPVQDAPGESWRTLDAALRKGVRGMAGGSSLRRLLAKKRGVRNPYDLPPLAPEQIVEWADLHRRRTGAWPKDRDGPVADAPGETWRAVDWALRLGKRGLPGGSSLAKLLEPKGEPERGNAKAEGPKGEMP